MRACYLITVILVGLLWVAGCATHADPRMVGTYYGADNESIEFLPDRMVIHVHKLNGYEERADLGYFTSTSDDVYALGISGPDTSPYLGASLRMNFDFSVVTLTWRDWVKAPPRWQSVYRRKVTPIN